MARIDLKPAHRELKKLLRKLKGKDVSGLQRSQDPTVGEISISPEAWVEQVDRAERELRGWCKFFSIEVKPKTKSLKTTATRGRRRTR